jgi:hypothetical protein
VSEPHEHGREARGQVQGNRLATLPPCHPLTLSRQGVLKYGGSDSRLGTGACVSILCRSDAHEKAVDRAPGVSLTPARRG